MSLPSNVPNLERSVNALNSTTTAQPEIRRVKAALRVTVLNKLKQMSAEERARDSLLACARLEQTVQWRQARAILVYAPFAEELDIAPAVRSALGAGKIIALPQYDSERRIYRASQIVCSLEQVPIGRFGIREPGKDCPTISMNQLDFMLVPGVAFDGSGRRLGAGAATTTAF